jgi:hypothetical protein
MHPSVNSLDFRVSAPAASPLPPSKNITKINEQKKSGEDVKNSDKRPPSPSTSSTVKPPYSYIALSNYAQVMCSTS